jgi:zinc transport system permease protein
MASIVGIVMVIALLTIPAAVSSLFCKNLWQMMVASALLTMVFTSGGLAVSYIVDVPSGSMIIVVAGCFYLLSLIARWGIMRISRKKGIE